MSMNFDPADLLEQAADRLESGELTWGQGDYWAATNYNLDVCYLGALVRTARCDLNALSHTDNPVYEAMEASATYIADMIGGWHPDAAHDVVAIWNDEDGRTVAEVVDVMKHVAKDLRNKS